MKIHKQQLKIAETFTCLMPKRFLARSLQVQYGIPTLWYEFEPYELVESETRFFCVGTGHNIPVIARNYLGTVVMPDGFVWHYYTDYHDYLGD